LEAHTEGRYTVSSDIVEEADRKLNVVAAAGPTPMPAPSPCAYGHRFCGGSWRSCIAQLTYKPLAVFRLPDWRLWPAALVALLLSAGLALPHREMTQIMPDQVTATLISPLRRFRCADLFL